VFAGNFPMKSILGVGNIECQPLPHFRLSGSFLGLVSSAGCFNGRTPLGTGYTYCAAGRAVDARCTCGNDL
jgi:hypothetical protein